MMNSFESLIRILRRIKIMLKCTDGSIIKSIYYNFKYLPRIQAKELPLIIAKNTKIIGPGKIVLETPFKTIYVGNKALNWADSKMNYTLIYNEGILKFTGSAFIGLGTNIEIGKKGILVLGDGFNITGLSKIICYNRITFGNDNLISWDTLIMDTDSHTIISEDGSKNNLGKIVMGDHVWLCSNSTVLKNSFIGNDNVISCNSVVNGEFKESNVVISGNRAMIVKKNIKWMIEEPENFHSNEFSDTIFECKENKGV